MAGAAATKKSSTPALTPEQKRAAQNAAAKDRRAIAAAIKKAELNEKPSELTAEQRQRALESGDKKAGLAGKALANWIMDGKGIAAQADEGRVAADAKAAEGRAARRNATRSSDPDAATLAKAAAALAPDVKSAILPKDAREFLDVVMKRGANDGTVDGLLSREVQGEAEGETKVVSITLKALKDFSVENDKNKDVRAHLVALGAQTRLWGRKLGLLMLAHRAAAAK